MQALRGSWIDRPPWARAAAPIVIALALLVVVVYGNAAAHAVTVRGGRTDFASGYTAGTIVRAGNVRQMYDLHVQGTVGDQVMAPEHITLPYQEMPLGAVALAPLSLLPLATAFGVWSLLQFLLVLISVAVAVRATPRARPRSVLAAVAVAGIALTQVGLENLVAVGQWTGVNALGVAMAYRCWRRGSNAAGGAWLIASAAIFKPHLALGLAAFLVGWGNRRVLLGALGSAVAAAATAVALIGVGGIGAMVADSVGQAGRWSQRGGASFFALPSMWFNDSAMAYVVGAAGACLCLALCFALGRRLRSDSRLLGPALAAATALSLLASPHAYLYDAVMLAPAVAWSLAELGLFSTAQRRGLDGAWTIVALWAVLPWIQQLLTDALLPLVLRIGMLDVWFTIALAAALWTVPAQARARAHTRLVRPGDLVGTTPR